MPHTSRSNEETILLIQRCFEGYIKERNFFRRWFIEWGTAFFFIFKKNLNVTNIQYAELLSLIVRNRTDSFQGSGRLQFLTVQEFNATIAAAVETFIGVQKPSPQEELTAYRLIAERYSDLLANVVVIDPLFGSCAVYLPPDVHINLASVCAQSGYIHSCGRNVFMRNVAKIWPDTLYEALNSSSEDRKWFILGP